MRSFTTIIKPNTRLNNEYVQGRISAVLRLIAKPAHGLHQGRLTPKNNRYGKEFDNAHFFTLETDEENYIEAAKIIESWYPFLCRFDCRSSNDNDTE